MTTINFMNSLATANLTNEANDRYQMVMQNVQKIGNKYFATIFADMLVFDMSYQRNDMIRTSKIKALAENWEDALCDPIKVSPHPETNNFAVYDGGHRYIVQTNMGRRLIVCEIAMELENMNPEDRRREEAKRFAKQSDNVDRLSAVQKHDANVIIGNPANLLLEALANKYGVTIKKKNVPGRTKQSNTITGFGTALEIASKKENYLEEAFKVICNSGWNKGSDGFSAAVFDSLENIYVNHSDLTEKITKELIKWFRKVEPEYIASLGNTEYPMRKAKAVRMTLVIEDHLHKTIGCPYTYTKKQGIGVAEI